MRPSFNTIGIAAAVASSSAAIVAGAGRGRTSSKYTGADLREIRATGQHQEKARRVRQMAKIAAKQVPAE